MKNISLISIEVSHRKIKVAEVYKAFSVRTRIFEKRIVGAKSELMKNM